jgi:hypothetical protein
LLVVAFMGVACGTPVDATQRTTGSTATTPTTRPGAVALVLDTGVPTHPPNVALVAQHAGRQIVQPGAPYTHDWTIGGVADLWGSAFPVPWPSASAIGRTDNPVLTFDTRVMPDWVVVRTYARLETADLIPEAIPVAQQGCVRLDVPRCHFEATESGLRITGLDPSMLAGPYIVVFCMWHVPLAMQKAQNSASSYEVAASWLFHISTPVPEVP